MKKKEILEELYNNYRRQIGSIEDRYYRYTDNFVRNPNNKISRYNFEILLQDKSDVQIANLTYSKR